MTDYVFNYSSVVVDNLVATARLYEQIGLVRVWEGRHPQFQTPAVLMATGKGGTLLLEGGSTKHAALAALAGSKERNFHISLLVKDLSAQRARCQQSSFVRHLTDDYEGPSGRSLAAELDIGTGRLWMEFTEGLDHLVGDARARFDCVDSTAMVARKRTDIVAPLESVSLPHSQTASDGFFKVLEGINEIIVMDWHYLEVNEPTKDNGVMANFLARMGRPGIFGVNYVPRDIAEFVETAKRFSIDINTPQPIRLMVEVHGKQYGCAEIVTINPRATGGARIFVLKPLEYPWKLVA
jgi:hypothetical protein